MMQQGDTSQRHSFQIRHTPSAAWLYPCSITGAPELGYSFLFARSTRRSIRLLRFCLVLTISTRLSENRFETYSSSSAYLYFVGRYSMTEGGGCQEENCIVRLSLQERLFLPYSHFVQEDKASRHHQSIQLAYLWQNCMHRFHNGL